MSRQTCGKAGTRDGMYHGHVRLSELVAASDAVTQTASRREKTRRLAELVTRLREDEVRVAVAFLSGALTQGRIGLGWSAIAEASSVQPSSNASLELVDVNAAFSEIAGASGSGSTRV